MWSHVDVANRENVGIERGIVVLQNFRVGDTDVVVRAGVHQVVVSLAVETVGKHAHHEGVDDEGGHEGDRGLDEKIEVRLGHGPLAIPVDFLLSEEGNIHSGWSIRLYTTFF